MKKGLSVLLALCLMVTMLPAVLVRAEEGAAEVSVVRVASLPRPVPDGEQELEAAVSVDVSEAFDRAEVTWFDLGTDEFATVGTQMEAGETFTLGHRVYARIRVFLKPGYSFVQKSSYSSVYLGSVEMDDRDSQFALTVQKQNNQEYLDLQTLPYPVNNDILVTDISVEGLTLGVEGDLPDCEASVTALPDGALKNVSVQWWRDGAAQYDVPLTDGFYSVRLYLYFNKGYYPCDPEFRYKGNLNVAGWNVSRAIGAHVDGSATCLWVDLEPRLVGVYTIHLDPGIGSGTADPISLSGDEEVFAPNCPFASPQGYLFDHWQYPLSSGKTAAVKPQEQIDKQTLSGSEITLTAVYRMASEINTIRVDDISQPVPGQLPDLEAEVSTNQSDAIESVLVQWYREGGEQPLGPEEVFLADENYFCTLTVHLNWGYLPRYESSGSGLRYTGSVSWADYNEAEGCSIVMEEAETAVLYLKSPIFCLNADVTDLEMPYHGLRFDSDVTLLQDDISLLKVAWYDNAAETWIQPGETAKAGETYRYEIVLQPSPKKGTGCFSGTDGVFAGEASINGLPLDSASARIVQSSENVDGLTVEKGSLILSGEYTTFAFEDVRGKDWFADAVYWAARTNVTNGTDSTHFSPLRVCTRGEIVTFLWRYFGSPAPETTENPFVDVKADQYYTDAVLWAVEKGITNGVDSTHFKPNNTCTRAEAATFLWRACGKPDPINDVNPFTDVRPGKYYTTAVLWAVEQGITNGTGANTFSPSKTCTRAEIVTFLYRLAQNATMKNPEQ